MSQKVLDTKNPYEEAWKLQNKMIAIDQQIQDLQAQKTEIQNNYNRAITQGENAGLSKVGEYSLIIETKTTERRKVKIDALKQLNPSLLTRIGKIPMGFASEFLTAKTLAKMTSDPIFEKVYEVKLTDLDSAIGGKKNSAPYVDIEVVPTITKRISRIENPIIEV